MPILSHIEDIIIFIATGYGLFKYSQIKLNYIKYYVWVLFISSVGLAILYISSNFIKDYYLVRIVYPISMALHLILFFKIFNNRFPFNKLILNCIKVIIGIFCVYVFYQITFNFENEAIASDSFLLFSILILPLILDYFFKLYNSKEIISLKNEPLFWIATGALFYYSSNIFATGLFHRLYENHKIFAQSLYKLNYIFGIADTLLAMVAIYLSTNNYNE